MKTTLIGLCLGLLAGYGALAEQPTPIAEMPASISKAKWIYAGTCRDDSPTNAFIRLSFEVKGEVTKAEIWWQAERCRGVWLNGERQNCGVLPRFRRLSEHQKATGADFAAKLRPGRNVLAFSNFRLKDIPGCQYCFGNIVRGEIEYADGRVQEIVSCAESCRGTGPAEPKGWELPEFDDSGWRPCWNQGDARLTPWSNYGDMDEQFCSAGEYAAYKAVLSRGFDEQKLLAEPDSPNAKIVYRGQTPAIESNGRIYPPILFSSNLIWSPERDELLGCAQRISCDLFKIDLGERYLVGATDGRENSYFGKWDLHIRRILAINPEARFVLVYHCHLNAYGPWMEKHPEECVGYADPVESRWAGDYSACPVAPSFASPAYRAETARFLRQAGEYFRSKPWGRRIIGINAGYGPSNDGMPYGCNRMPDTGLRMTQAFRRFLAGKYRTDAALRKAWGDDKVTLATASVPDKTQRFGSGAFVRDLSNVRDVRIDDYYAAYQKEYLGWQLAFARAAKEAFPGILVGFHSGYSILSYVPEGATSNIEPLLASPDVDFMNATVRGYHLTDSLHRHIHSVFHRYGKLSLIEGDVRTHVAGLDGKGENFWTCRTPAETRASVAKFVANSCFHGCGYYTVDFGSPKWFSCPESIETLSTGLEVWKKLWRDPPRPTADVAVIFDVNEVWKEGSPDHGVMFPYSDNLLTYPLQTLNFSGYAYDVYAPEDFVACGRDYKAVVFLNTFEATPTLMAAARKARKPGATAVWCYAPGLRTAKGYSTETMKKLTGLDLAVRKDPVPLTGKFADGSDFSFRHFSQYRLDPVKVYDLKPNAPRVSCIDKGADARAFWDDDKGVSLARKKLSDGSAAVFAGLPFHRSVDWAKILAEAGCHAFTKPGFLTRRNSRLLMVFSGKGSLIPMESCIMHGQMDQSGRVDVSLERPARKVTDLFSGEVVTTGTDKFTLTSEEPRVWLLEVE